MTSYEYEVRQGDDVVATGLMQLDEPPAAGDELTLGRDRVRVEDVLPTRAGTRLILERV